MIAKLPVICKVGNNVDVMEPSASTPNNNCCLIEIQYIFMGTVRLTCDNVVNCRYDYEDY